MLCNVRRTTLAERCCTFDKKIIDKGRRIKHNDVEGAKLEASNRAILLGPAGDRRVRIDVGDLVDVAEKGEGWRAGRVVPWTARGEHETGCSV